MKHFVENIFFGNLIEAKEDLVDRIEELVNEKIEGILSELSTEIYGNDESIDEGNIQKMGRTKLIRVRIRKGKVQRRVKKSATPGYTVRGGK